MSKHLYISNVGPNVTLQDLTELFRQCGSVEKVTILKGYGSKRIGRAAFVSMTEPLDATAAVQKLNGHLLEGCPLTVSEFEPSEQLASS